jgi:autotransporter-associated beta strand protein
MGARAIRRKRGARRLARSYAPRVALAALLLTFPRAAPAAEFLVTNTNNSGSGSLRQAIQELNALGAVVDEQHRIAFDDTTIADGSVIGLLTPLDNIAVDVDIDASDVLNLSLQGPAGVAFLRTATTRVTLIDLASDGSIIEIGGGNDLGFDISDGPDEVDVLVSSDIRQVTDAGGTLTKDGLGTLDLSGELTFSFRTLVNDGTLIVRGTPPAFGNIDIEESGTFVFDLATPRLPFTLSGQLNGSGELVKRNADPLADVTLIGGGAFTGLTRIEGGVLTDASGVIQGDVELGDAASANLVFEVGLDQTWTHSGNISGTGNLTKTSEGSLTLLGNNTYAGTLSLKEGTLIGSSTSLPGNIVASEEGDTTLIFDQSSTGTFAGTISDAGPGGTLSLEKRGSGTLTLSGDVDALSGTTISAGELIIGADLDTPTTMVSAGTVLSGTGTISNGDVTVVGTLAPGPEVALDRTLTVSGNVDFQPGSVFEVNIDPAEGDQLVASTATINGASIHVIAEPGNYAPIGSGTPIRILDATNGFSGLFPDLEADFAFLEETLDQDATAGTIDLTLEDNLRDIIEFATTANQSTVADVLDAERDALPATDPDLDEVFASIQVMLVDEVEPMLDAVGGEPLSAFPNAQLAIGERLNRVVHRRVRDAVWGEPDALYTARVGAPSPVPTANRGFAASPRVALPGMDAWRAQTRGRRAYTGPLGTFEGDTGVGAWLDGWGSLGDLEGDGSSADVEIRSFGVTFGLDYRFGERFSAGLAGGYANADIELDGRASQGDVDLAQGALYAGYVDPRFHVTASGRYGHAWNDSERLIAFLGRTAKASFESQDVGARAEIGAKALRLGPLDVAPLAAFDWAQLRRDDFTESGADSLDLVVEDETLTSLLSSVGGSLRGFYDLGDDVAMVAELRGFWLHEFGDVERPIRAFEIFGAELPRDRILAGLGWSASIGDVVRVFADYDVGLGSGLLQHEVTLALRIHF